MREQKNNIIPTLSAYCNMWRGMSINQRRRQFTGQEFNFFVLQIGNQNHHRQWNKNKNRRTNGGTLLLARVGAWQMAWQQPWLDEDQKRLKTKWQFSVLLVFSVWFCTLLTIAIYGRFFAAFLLHWFDILFLIGSKIETIKNFDAMMQTHFNGLAFFHPFAQSKIKSISQAEGKGFVSLLPRPISLGNGLVSQFSTKLWAICDRFISNDPNTWPSNLLMKHFAVKSKQFWKVFKSKVTSF